MDITLNMFMMVVVTETFPHGTDYAAVETLVCYLPMAHYMFAAPEPRSRVW